LGWGTNNIGELTGVALALEAVLAAPERALTAPLVIYTDSTYALGVLCQGHQAKVNVELVERVQALLALCKETREVSILWVKAHVGIAGNERADVLAGRGAERSRSMRT
jgi:ribonuclease HI